MVQRHVLDQIRDERLKIYVVWGPMLNKETREDVPAATAFLPDRRTTHFWTGVHTLAEVLSGTIGLEGDRAWDTFLLYPPGALWQEAPPTPSYVMHVGKRLPQEQRLNGDKLRLNTQKLLEAK